MSQPNEPRILWEATDGPLLDGAACKGMDPSPWFPTLGNHGHQAKAICATCPARRACLEYALTTPGIDGIWGGTSVEERKRLKRSRQRRRGVAA